MDSWVMTTTWSTITTRISVWMDNICKANKINITFSHHTFKVTFTINSRKWIKWCIHSKTFATHSILTTIVSNNSITPTKVIKTEACQTQDKVSTHNLTTTSTKWLISRRCIFQTELNISKCRLIIINLMTTAWWWWHQVQPWIIKDLLLGGRLQLHPLRHRCHLSPHREDLPPPLRIMTHSTTRVFRSWERQHPSTQGVDSLLSTLHPSHRHHHRWECPRPPLMEWLTEEDLCLPITIIINTITHWRMEYIWVLGHLLKRTVRLSWLGDRRRQEESSNHTFINSIIINNIINTYIIISINLITTSSSSTAATSSPTINRHMVIIKSYLLQQTVQVAITLFEQLGTTRVATSETTIGKRKK